MRPLTHDEEQDILSMVSAALCEVAGCADVTVKEIFEIMDRDAVAREREACARMADECTLRLTSPDSERSQTLYVGGADDASMSIARDIRARSNPSK